MATNTVLAAILRGSGFALAPQDEVEKSFAWPE
jgi:hypothetical protein